MRFMSLSRICVTRTMLSLSIDHFHSLKLTSFGPFSDQRKLHGAAEIAGGKMQREDENVSSLGHGKFRERFLVQALEQRQRKQEVSRCFKENDS